MFCFHLQPDCKDPIISKEIFWIFVILLVVFYLIVFVVFVYRKCISDKQKTSTLENSFSSTHETFSDDIGSVKQYPDTIIQAQINGWPCLALIDTGSPVTLINKNFLNKIEDKSTRFYLRVLNLIGLNGKAEPSNTLVKTFMKIENKKFKLRLQLNNSLLQTPYDIVLGKDFLNGKIYTEDTINKTFSISNVTTKTIDINNLPGIKVAVGHANQGYIAREGVSRTARHPVYMYDSVEHPGITFTFGFKRTVRVGATYYCTHCDSAKRIQKTEGRKEGKVATINFHEGYFTENPDTIAHICFNEMVHATRFQAEADQLLRHTYKHLRENPAPPMIALNNLNSHINRAYGADAVHVTNALPKKNRMYRIFNLNSAMGRPNDIDPHDIPENMQLSPSMRGDGVMNKIVRYFNRDENTPPFVVMMDVTNLRCIHGASDLTFDGTFQYAPANMPNGQIYTMHASYHNLPYYNSNFLVGIAIVQNRDHTTYEKIFTVIREQLIAEFGDIGPQKTIHMDHEVAAITAAQRVFPEWIMHSCYFHLGKNLRTRMGQLLLGVEGVGRWFNALCGSCHLPLPWQQEVVNHLVLNLPPVEPHLVPRLGNFVHYFQNFWQPKLPLVNFYGKGGVRTTNAAEGFHNSLNTLFENRQHPSFTKVFLHLRDLLCSHHAEYSKFINGAGLDLREKLFRISESKIIQATNIISQEFYNNRHPDIEVLLSFCRHVSLLSSPKVNSERLEDYNWNYQPPIVYVIQQDDAVAPQFPPFPPQPQFQHAYPNVPPLPHPNAPQQPQIDQAAPHPPFDQQYEQAENLYYDQNENYAEQQNYEGEYGQFEGQFEGHNNAPGDQNLNIENEGEGEEEEHVYYL